MLRPRTPEPDPQRHPAHPSRSVSLSSSSLLLRKLTPLRVACVVLLSWLLVVFLPRRAAGQCGPSPPLPPVVNVALLTFCRAPVGVMQRGPMFGGCANANTTLPPNVIAYHFGTAFYISQMTAQQPIPLKDGSHVSFNYTYLNLGQVDWVSGNTSSLNLGTVASGLLRNMLLTPQYGGPYTFVVPQLLFPVPESLLLANICEESQGCVVLHPFSALTSTHLCTEPLPPDCVARGRVEGVRRFNTLLGVLYDVNNVAASAMELYRQLGIKRLALLGEGTLVARFSTDSLARTEEVATQLNMRVVHQVQLVPCNLDAGGGNCPRALDGTFSNDQVMILPNGTTPRQYVEHLRESGVEALTILLSAPGKALRTVGLILEAMREVNWTPKQLNFGGGGESQLRPHLSDYSLMLYTYSTAPWDPRLTGAEYRNKKTASNFELLPSEGEKDGPAVYAREFNRWFKTVAKREWDFSIAGGAAPVLPWQALTFAQKLVETALSADVPTLTTAAMRVNTPSVFHQLHFDTSGRTYRVNDMLVQNVPAGNYGPTTAHLTNLIYPYNIGVEPVFPMPTWEERVFNPVQYAQPLEKMMAAITAVCIAACIILAVLVMLHARHAVIRAATPSFCLLTILGAIVMLSSNFFHTRVASDSHCAAQVWLLSLGFTMLFSALFIKTFRIWKIFFSSKKLSVVKMKDRDLLIAVAAFLLVDVIINAAWAGVTGQTSRIRVIDPHRPALNIVECDYTDAEPFIFAHIAIKGALLLFGICLTYAVRNTPSQFNESTFIAIAIYNVSVLICFILPILAVRIGGRDNYLVRAFAVMVVSLSTVLILYVPKILAIRRGSSAPSAGAAGGSSLEKTMSPPSVLSADARSGSSEGLKLTSKDGAGVKSTSGSSRPATNGLPSSKYQPTTTGSGGVTGAGLTRTNSTASSTVRAGASSPGPVVARHAFGAGSGAGTGAVSPKRASAQSSLTLTSLVGAGAVTSPASPSGARTPAVAPAFSGSADDQAQTATPAEAQLLPGSVQDLEAEELPHALNIQS